MFIERSEDFNELTLGFLENIRDSAASKLPKQEPVKPRMLKKLISFL